MLSELEKDILQPLLQNELLLKTIRKVFELTAEDLMPKMNGQNNELLGAQYRAYEESKRMIDMGFINLESLKINEKYDKSFNKAR